MTARFQIMAASFPQMTPSQKNLTKPQTTLKKQFKNSKNTKNRKKLKSPLKSVKNLLDSARFR
jgi:hypothetical protein